MMSSYEFIFSEKTWPRITRHLVFWLVFSVHVFLFRYYVADLKYLGYGSTYLIRFKNLLLFLPVSVFYAYFAIRFLLPRFVLKERYGILAIVVLALCMLLLLFSYFVSTQLDIRLAFDMPLNRTAIVRQTDFTVNNGVVYPLTASVFAIGIKMAKNFYLQQKQYELLSKQKIAAEVQLLKSQVHPRFLFRSLNSIYHHMLKGSVHSPEMLLKLSDLLSYILYESDTGLVPLEKELILLRNYIDLEKSNWGDKLSVQEKENIRGSDKMVAPLLLLPLAEYIFEIADGYRQQQLLLISQISVIENTFLLSLGIVGNVEESLDPLKENIQLQQVQKRLQALYNGKHDFKIAADEGGVAVSLSIELQDEIKTAQ